MQFDLDIGIFKLNYFDFSISPGLSLELNAISDKWEKSAFICEQKFAPISILTPLFGLPIILRPKIYLFLVYGANGEFSITSTIQYECSATCGLKYQNGKWGYIAKNNNMQNEQPWFVSELKAKGEIYVGDKIGFLCGFYLATTGFGTNIIPKLKIGFNFKFNSTDLLCTNPGVKFSAAVQGELYFTASVFRKKIGHSIGTPKFEIWKHQIPLMPQIINFSATGNGSSGGTGVIR